MATIQRPSPGGSAFRSGALGPLRGASLGWEGQVRAVPAAEHQRLSKCKVLANAQGGHRTGKSPSGPVPRPGPSSSQECGRSHTITQPSRGDLSGLGPPDYTPPGQGSQATCRVLLTGMWPCYVSHTCASVYFCSRLSVTHTPASTHALVLSWQFPELKTWGHLQAAD